MVEPLSMNNFVVVMLVHQGFDKIKSVVDFFIESKVGVVIHVDLSSKELNKNLELEYFESEFCQVISKVDCKWGEWSLVEAELFLYRQALSSYPNTKYFHFMSGSDIPLVSCAEFDEFLSKSIVQNFIEVVDISMYKFVISGSDNDRLEYYYPFNYISHNKMFKYFLLFQKIFNLKRKFPLGFKPYSGRQFKTLHKDTVVLILELISKNKGLTSYYKWSWIPDESFFPTVVAYLIKNGDISDSLSSPLTYSVFNQKGKPIIVYPDHVHSLRDSGYFFARKYDQDSALYFPNLELSFGISNTNNDRLPGNGEMNSICECNVNFLIIDSELNENKLHRISLKTKEKALFLGQLDSDLFDHLIDWKKLTIDKNELLHWRKFSLLSFEDYIQNILIRCRQSILITVPFGIISEEKWDLVLKKYRARLIFMNQPPLDFRFNKLESIAKSNNTMVYNINE